MPACPQLHGQQDLGGGYFDPYVPFLDNGACRYLLMWEEADGSIIEPVWFQIVILCDFSCDGHHFVCWVQSGVYVRRSLTAIIVERESCSADEDDLSLGTCCTEPLHQVGQVRSHSFSIEVLPPYRTTVLANQGSR